MKRFLLSLACVASMAMMASAETVTFDVSGENGYGMTLLEGSTNEYNPDGMVLTEGAVTITLHGNTRWWKNSKGNQLRFYKESGMTVAANGVNINKIEFNPTNIQLGGDGFAAGVWTGDAASVTLNATNTKGNTYCNKITVTYGEQGGDTPEPQSQYGKYEAATAVAAGDFLIYSSDKIATPLSGSYGYLQVADATVKDGAIVALKANQFKLQADGEYYNILDAQGRYLYMKGTYNSFNVDTEKPAEGAQWAVTVNADGTFEITNVTMSKTIQYDPQYNSFGCYADVRGVKPVLYRYVADAENTEPEPEVPVVESLAAVNALENNAAFKMGVDLTVVYANGSYVYVYDGANYALIYKRDLGLESTNVIAKGWEGKVTIFKNLIELVPNDATLATTGTAGQVPAPTVVTAENAATTVTAANQNMYVQLKDVVFDAATPAPDAESAARSYTGKIGTLDVTFYQRFGLDSYPAGTYNVDGFISVYGDQVQVYPTAINSSTGISAITGDDADARYYNINGVEVSNPEQGGLYIRVAGGKATKVIK